MTVHKHEPNENEIDKSEIGRFSNYTHSTFIVSPVNNTFLVLPPASLPSPPLLHLSLYRWTPPRASEGQSAHVYSAGPGNNDVMAHTLFHVSAVNRPAASVRSKPRLSQNLPVSILTLEIATMVLTLCWRYRESTSKFSKYPHIPP